ncbi:MAG: rhodanese-like domain-containing protein [Chlorobiales bacterium]|nr:rhodanese-like domain-containing protein [Chlorobiales bacterium]
MSNIKNVSPKEAQLLIRRGAVLIDVREPRELSRMAFDVESCMNIPLSRIEQRHQEIPANKQVIVACQRGNRRLAASRFLISHGHRKLVNLQGGISRWAGEGMAVKQEPKQSLLARILQLFSKKA